MLLGMNHLASRATKKPMTELVGLMTKVLVSGVLVLLSCVFVWQAWRIWVGRTLVLAPFDFLEAGKPAAESGEQFARMIRADLVQLAVLYNAGEVSNAGAVPSASAQEPVAPMELPSIFDTSFFDTMELKAYGLELGSIVKTLRRQLESPSEIRGSVVHQGDKYSVFVELTRQGGGAESLRRWNIQYAKDLPGATRDVACRLFRHLAGSSTNVDAPLFRSIDDEDFCLFNLALAVYDQYRLRKAVLSADESTKLLTETDAPLATLLGREPITFPYVHKLAALVFFEKKKYAEAEAHIERYIDWLTSSRRTDPSAEPLRTTIRSRKLQTMPVISKNRPIRPGTSVGLAGSNTAGMICCIVKDAAGVRYILAAVQVLGSMAKAKVVQPSILHGGTGGDEVAEVTKATATVTLARLREDVLFDPAILELGQIQGLDSKPADGTPVVTYGFDGQRKEGQVVSTATNIPVTLDDESGKSVIVDCVITSKISSGNELGAPVITAGGNLIGMIFASGGPTTLVLPIEPLLKELGVQLVK
jgi:hypothetical protein